MGEVINIGSAIFWKAQETEYGITVGRYIHGHFEDINFDTIEEYLEWKNKTGAKVLERF